MGETSPRASTFVVTDAGSLIHLGELDSLELLADFKQVWVPDSVWGEVELHYPQALHSLYSILIRKDIPPASVIIDALTPIYTLHTGERDALAWCLGQQTPLFLTDDTAARLAAKSLGVAAHGTIGLLIRAIRRQLRTKAEVLQLLTDIPQRTTLHVRPSFLTEVIREVEEKA